MLLYESKSRPWSALELLLPVVPEAINLSQQAKEQLEAFFWKDLASEYDAENFCVMLEESGLTFSDEFISFEKVWRRDEYNHYLGFRRIYSLFYGEDEEAITERLKRRKPDFKDMEEFITDEFKLCLILAYDEIVTTRAYGEDVPFYKSLGPDAFNAWIKNVRADEAVHYLNCIRVAQVRHRDRLPEAKELLQRILEIDLNMKEYHATFVLDHKGAPFTPEMLRECADTIVDVLSRPVPSLGFY
jgi:hypothetical protein